MQTRIGVLVLSAFVAVAAHAQLSDATIVANGFPSELDDGDGVRYSRYVTADLNRDNQPLVVAIYSNGARGVLRVFNKSGQLVSQSSMRGMRGFHGSVQLLDLNADGTPEIIVSMTSGHAPDNPDTWIFRWSAGLLQLISPTCSVGSLALSCLNQVSFVDMQGFGRLSILAWPVFHIDPATGAAKASGPWTLYVETNGTFQPAPSTFGFVREFSRGTGASFTSQRDFSATAGATTLRLVTGTGAESITSGHITLNGKEIIGPSDFKRRQHLYELPVTLLTNNTLKVQLDGKPGSKITVLIDGTGVAGSIP